MLNIADFKRRINHLKRNKLCKQVLMFVILCGSFSLQPANDINSQSRRKTVTVKSGIKPSVNPRNNEPIIDNVNAKLDSALHDLTEAVKKKENKPKVVYKTKYIYLKTKPDTILVQVADTTSLFDFKADPEPDTVFVRVVDTIYMKKSWFRHRKKP